jgi:tetratricopeptide (TPR) repeat protein
MQEARSQHSFLWKAVALTAFGLSWSAPAALAKQASLTAIELYDGPSGAAYLQLSDVLINGKFEMRNCTPFQAAAIDHSTYGKMEKLALAPGGVLERGEDGVLRYSAGQGQAVCVAPENVKFDHNASYTASELADRVVLTGTPIAPATVAAGSLPPLKQGVQIFFIASPDLELSEYLLAQRVGSVAGWSDFLSKYPDSPHAGDAKLALASLYAGAGEASLDAFRKSVAAGSPSYIDLKNSKVQADSAKGADPDLDQTVKLLGEIGEQLTAIADNGRGELNAYQDAFKSHAPGYVHLRNARTLSGAVTDVDASFPAGQALSGDVTQASDAFNSVLRSAESAVVAKHMDQALEAIAPLRPFQDEEPRIAVVVNAAYSYYLQLGKQFAEAADWPNAIKQYEKAVGAKDTSEARDALADAQKQLVIVEDKAAAVKALATSRDYEQQKDVINAFEVLYNLPPSQQALVSGDIDRLKDAYVESAVRAAKDLQKAHDPIRGLGDEIGMEKAYDYLQRAYDLSKVDSYQDTMLLLGNDLSAYFVDQAKRYLDKPAGSGTEMGWTYLDEALSFEPSNQTAHDAKVAAAPAHAMHSKISIRVQFRDQTSQRNSTGFIPQLEDAIITGLEAPTITAVRFGEATGGVEPDFQLAGDVLERQIVETSNLEATESKYRAGTHEDPNDEWNKANRAYDAAMRQLATDQSALQGVEAKGKKRDIEEMNAKVGADQKAVADAQALADSLPKTITIDVIRPYQYVRRTIDVKNSVKLQFRIGETLSGQMGDAVVVEKEDPRQFVLLEEVKADDTEGVKLGGTTPNTSELQTALENAARDELVQKVRLKVQELPRQVYDAGRAGEQEENVDGAGEYYLRYLSCTAENGSAERRHAKEFLAGKFNMRPAGDPR